MNVRKLVVPLLLVLLLAGCTPSSGGQNDAVDQAAAGLDSVGGDYTYVPDLTDNSQAIDLGSLASGTDMMSGNQICFFGCTQNGSTESFGSGDIGSTTVSGERNALDQSTSEQPAVLCFDQKLGILEGSACASK